jgi:adenine-specific DNA-methyltransferase
MAANETASEGIEVRHAVAVAIVRNDGLVLAVQRPDEPGEELPGVWGLPAITLRDGESAEGGVRRLGHEKLGVELAPLRPLASGEQQRADYTLHMTVYEASIAGEPSLQRAPSGTSHDALDWLPGGSFADAAARGSLCCELYLTSLTPGPSPASGRGQLRRQASRISGWVSRELRRKTVGSAREFRQAPTKSEAILWQAIRDRKLDGLKFRRQHPVGPYVADFCCTEARLIVEVNGPVHELQREQDRARQELLEAAGYHVLRVPSSEVEADVRQTVARIRAAVQQDS